MDFPKELAKQCRRSAAQLAELGLIVRSRDPDEDSAELVALLLEAIDTQAELVTTLAESLEGLRDADAR